MYLLDPVKGRGRRTVARDRVLRLLRRGGKSAGATARDSVHRLRGVVTESIHRVRHDEPSNDILKERVRSVLGHVCSHPHGVCVEVSNGQVRLTGKVLHFEADNLLWRVSRVFGVRSIDNRLDLLMEPVVA